ncbi:MAG TPA: ATP-binding protein [Thermoanaerobaculia bacterium]|nr:ATP-binding protein [Thermoanaerobaculia bacterium]
MGGAVRGLHPDALHFPHPVHQDLLLFTHLLIFVTGALLYGFLARELFRHPRVLPGRPMRLTVLCFTVWYGGCLVDQLASVLVVSPEPFGRAATVLDLLRGIAWLASFPLLTHGLWRLLEYEGEGHRPSRFWLAPGYATLMLFAPAVWNAWREGSILLSAEARAVYPWIVLHVTVASVASAGMVLRWLRLAREPRLVQFLRWLLGGLGVTAALIAAGGFLRVWGGEAWRLAVESSGLVLGLTFLYFVQRYNLLRLSMSYRSLRHFLGLLALVGLVMLVGSALGTGGTAEFRRIVAWGILAALLTAAVYTPLQQTALRRFAWLRRLLGVGITAEELEGLTRQLQSLDLPEDRMRELTAREIGQWLATRARFLEPGALPVLWQHFSAGDPEPRAFNRLDAPTPELAAQLQREDLQAAFPLKVAGELAGVLVVEISPAAGGYQEGDMEMGELVLRQLAVSLEVRRLLEERLSAERRLAERERLSLLGMVAASLAHELKNPLSGMKALAQTVHEELAAAAPGSEQARDLAMIVEQIDRLHGVSREILDFARSPDSPDGEGTDLAALLRGTLYVLGHQARRRGIELDAAGVEEVGRCGGTSATWQTVLFNLLLNAAQHAPAGSTVRVRLSRNGGGIVFATENAGPAIPPEIAGRLFEPFVTDGGTGLGLALAAQRVRELGGTIAVTNEPERIVFQVRLEEAEP